MLGEAWGKTGRTGKSLDAEKAVSTSHFLARLEFVILTWHSFQKIFTLYLSIYKDEIYHNLFPSLRECIQT